jgi:hypothetical protein
MKRLHTGARIMAGTALVTLSLLAAMPAHANGDPRAQAKRLHDRLAGAPPSPTVLDAMAAKIAGGDAIGAANDAMKASSFYNATLKNWITPWTNRDQTSFVPLNDYTATVIGIIRDDVDYRTILSGDVLYVGGSGLPAYSSANNTLYQTLEDTDANLGDPAVLVASTQSSHSALPPTATAGVLTTRAAAQAFFVAGTNRAQFRFTMLNHMCKDMEQVHDVTRPPDRIRQDVSRSPGGDSRLFLNNCIGCHSGMDPMAQAFAYYNYDETAGSIQYTAGMVQPKYGINSDNFKPGYITRSDGWDNYWRKGANQLLGWDGALPGTGNGAKSMGQELANSDQFAQCAVEKVFKTVCLRPPVDAADRAKVTSVKADFKAGGYKLKQVFAETAVYCMGQ